MFEREVRRLTNFGVAAVARALDRPADTLLELRCECGDPGCEERLLLRLGDYERRDGGPIVHAGHATA